MIVSLVMFSVLVTSVQFVSQASNSLRDTYYHQVAREAAESGVTMAQACLAQGNGEPLWSAVKPLRPHTDCSGNVIAGKSAHVFVQGNMRSTFSVDAANAVGGLHSTSVRGDVEVLNGFDNSTVSHSMSSTVKASIGGSGGSGGATMSTNIVTSVVGTCAQTTDDWLYCWGENSEGSVGDGTTVNRPVLTKVAKGAIPAGVTIKKVSVDPLSHSPCAVGSNGLLYCWGRSQSSPVAQAIPTGVTFKDVIVDTSLVCGHSTDNWLYCWGLGGLVGDGTAVDRLVPTKMAKGAIPTGVTIKKVSLYASTRYWVDGVQQSVGYGCMLGSDNRAYCWGERRSGNLGDGDVGSTTALSPVAVTMPTGVTFKDIFVYDGGACGHSTDDWLYCWGQGPIGDGTTTTRYIPTKIAKGAIPTGVTIKKVSGSCVLGSNDKAYCWGGPYAIGDGSPGPGPTPALSPVAVTMPAGIVFQDIFASGYVTCGLSASEWLYCWGAGGSVGDGTWTDRYIPTPIARGDMPIGVTIKQVVMSDFYTCILGSDGKIYNWGMRYSTGFGTVPSTGPGPYSVATSPVAATMPPGVTFGGGSGGGATKRLLY